MVLPELMFSDQLQPDHDLIVCVSGGKDSTALILWIEFESLLENKRFYVFADTGHENPVTLQYLEQIESKTGIAINRVAGPRTFEEMCIHNKRFPSALARFCTKELKIFPIKEFIEEKEGEGDIENPCLVQGVRADESTSRSKLPVWGYPPNSKYKSPYDAATWRPLLSWSTGDVIAIHRRHNMALNPLYRLGARRVGCWPCIFSSKSELKAANELDPDLFDRLRQMELKISEASGKQATFFGRGRIPERLNDLEYCKNDGSKTTVPSAYAVRDWCLGNRNQQTMFEANDEPTCWSHYGLCE